MTNQRWFAVKTFYRTTTKGLPKNRDEFYKAGLAAVEERVVLLTAKTPTLALKKGESEALKYAKSACTTNKYGQQVITEFTGYIDSYEMFDSPGNGVEIYSSIGSVPSSKTTRSLIAQRYGDQIDPVLAIQFISSEISNELDSVFGPEWPSQ